MTHKLKTEMFSQKIEYSGGVFFWPQTRYLVLLAFTLKKKKTVLYLLTQPENSGLANKAILRLALFWGGFSIHFFSF